MKPRRAIKFTGLANIANGLKRMWHIFWSISSEILIYPASRLPALEPAHLFA
jgi:hypothetical protein